MSPEKMAIKEAAEELSVNESEVKSMMKNGNLDVIDDGDGLPGVCERSLCEFKGEVWLPPTPKRRGRQPNVATLEEAMSVLNMEDVNEIKTLLNNDGLEAWTLPNSCDAGVTERSIKAYQEKLSEEVKQVVEDFEEEKQIEAKDEPLKELLTLAEDDPESFDEFVHTVAETIADDDVLKEVREEGSIDMISMKKHDFNAALNIASMRAELGVYRSLKSFERR